MGKRKKTILLLLMALTGGFAANAQTKLVVKTTGTSQPVNEFLLSEIVNCNMLQTGFFTVVSKNDNARFALRDIVSIRFKNSTSAIEMPTAGSEDALKLYCKGGKLGAYGLQDGKAAKAAVYDVSGRTVIAADNWNGEEIDIAGLNKGVYVFKVNNQTIKFTK